MPLGTFWMAFCNSILQICVGSCCSLSRWPMVVTAVDGCGISQFGEQKWEEKKPFLNCPSFYQLVANQPGQLETTGLRRSLVCFCYGSYSRHWFSDDTASVYFSLYSFELISVVVSWHDFAHDNMDAGLCNLSPVRFKTVQYKYMKTFLMFVVFRMSGCKFNKESSWFLLPFTPRESFLSLAIHWVITNTEKYFWSFQMSMELA